MNTQRPDQGQPWNAGDNNAAAPQGDETNPFAQPSYDHQQYNPYEQQGQYQQQYQQQNPYEQQGQYQQQYQQQNPYQQQGQYQQQYQQQNPYQQDYSQSNPYAPEQSGYGTHGFGQPAQLMHRLLARVIDGLVLMIPLFILNFAILLLSQSVIMSAVVVVLNVALMLGYTTYMESSRGATVGKSVMGLQVYGRNGLNPTTEQAFKRNIFYLVTLITIIPGSVFSTISSLLSLALMIGIAVTVSQDEQQRQGWHDKFAQTTVRKIR